MENVCFFVAIRVVVAFNMLLNLQIVMQLKLLAMQQRVNAKITDDYNAK